MWLSRWPSLIVCLCLLLQKWEKPLDDTCQKRLNDLPLEPCINYSIQVPRYTSACFSEELAKDFFLHHILSHPSKMGLIFLSLETKQQFFCNVCRLGHLSWLAIHIWNKGCVCFILFCRTSTSGWRQKEENYYAQGGRDVPLKCLQGEKGRVRDRGEGVGGFRVYVRVCEGDRWGQYPLRSK